MNRLVLWSKSLNVYCAKWANVHVVVAGCLENIGLAEGKLGQKSESCCENESNFIHRTLTRPFYRHRQNGRRRRFLHRTRLESNDLFSIFDMKLTIRNRIKIAWEALTSRSGHPHPSQEKQLSTFQRGYAAGMKDAKLSLAND